MADSLARLHGGEIKAHSEGRGCGSEFIINLPLAEQPSQASASPELCRFGQPTGRIVLVEDNSDARNLLEALLNDDGYQVQSATTGQEGLQLILESPPDIAIIDIGLPEMDGLAVARRIRAVPELQSVYLVALTGYGRPEDRRSALDAGFNVHLTKPVDLTRLERLLEERPERIEVD